MAGKSNLKENMALASAPAALDNIFSTEESRQDAKLQKVYEIPLSEIRDFPNHPYKVRDDDAMTNLTESIKQRGVQVPVLVRPHPDGGYEMVSGHRRKRASVLAGYDTVPTIIKEMTDDEAIVLMVESNFQRDELLPSEKAFAYKMRLEAMKRQGLTNKSMIVVPNHIIGQFAGEFLQLYPSANILVANKKDFEPARRKKFCARIATGDYDAVIIGHSQFEKIPVSMERRQMFLENQIDELMQAIQEAKAEKAESFTIKQMEGMRKSLEVKLKRLNDTTRKDNVIDFEMLGVDRLFVDEADNYKNLFLQTKMRNVAGIAQTEAQKSSDMYMKSQYINEITDYRGMVFATGTPISNSMVELYTMQRYLQPQTLRFHGLHHFDSWAAAFGERVTALEIAPEGTGYESVETRGSEYPPG
ncbi:ParB/RepB/Spo0J family partition protein [Christensenellaceae bacterium OttesenSCG-928-L17]|nr:ParB/RepB/Spo0J family partition protein [Christensenellaceae bacterium OttesenSCG-928-L17]